MFIIAIIGALAVVSAFGVMWWAVSGERRETMNLADPRSGPDQRDLMLRKSGAERTVQPMMQRIGAKVRSLTPSSRLDNLNHKIQQAGSPEGWTVERFLSIRVLMMVAFGILGLFVFLDEPGLARLLLAIAFVAVAYWIPTALLDRRISERKLSIRGDLADTIDQLTVMVRAGLGIDAAMARAASMSSGPMSEELNRVIQDMRFGISRNVALNNMAERVDVPELKSFVAALSHAERMGAPISQTLTAQSEELRDRRRKFAEEQAMKLPVKIIFPTVLCILPVLLIVVLAPAGIRIFDLFGS